METRTWKQYSQAWLYEATTGLYRHCCVSLKALIMSHVPVKSQRSTGVAVKTGSPERLYTNPFIQETISVTGASFLRSSDSSWLWREAWKCAVLWPLFPASTYIIIFISTLCTKSTIEWLRIYRKLLGETFRAFFPFEGGMSMLVILITGVKERVLEHSNSHRKSRGFDLVNDY